MDPTILISAIEQADGILLDLIADAVRNRYHALYPDEEIIFLSLPRHDYAERRRILELLPHMDISKTGTA